MKKIGLLLFMFAIIFSFTACGDNEKTNETQDNNATASEAVESTENPDTTQEEDDETSEMGLSITYKVPMKDIYIDAPDFFEIELGYTELFIVDQEKYVAITAARKSEATDSEDAHAKAFEKFDGNMDNYEGGVNRIDISYSETKSVNDLDVYYFEGTINYGTDEIHDGYAVGYSFVMDGIPCEIIGSVISEDQADATKNEIAELVDEMMASVRAEQ